MARRAQEIRLPCEPVRLLAASHAAHPVPRFRVLPGIARLPLFTNAGSPARWKECFRPVLGKLPFSARERPMIRSGGIALFAVVAAVSSVAAACDRCGCNPCAPTCCAAPVVAVPTTCCRTTWRTEVACVPVVTCCRQTYRDCNGCCRVRTVRTVRYVRTCRRVPVTTCQTVCRPVQACAPVCPPAPVCAPVCCPAPRPSCLSRASRCCVPRPVAVCCPAPACRPSGCLSGGCLSRLFGGRTGAGCGW